MSSAIAAHETKHLATLTYPLTDSLTLSLHQTFAPTTTGTTLWSSAQVLCEHLLSLRHPRPLRALDLGAGIGLTSLALAAIGHEVVATDVPPVIELLARNVEANAAGLKGNICVRELDWTDEGGHAGEFDIVVTADTVYESSLIEPLIDTLVRHVGKKTVVWLAFERRDNDVEERALEGLRAHGLVGKKVRAGRGEWEGIEVWKFQQVKLKKEKTAVPREIS